MDTNAAGSSAAKALDEKIAVVAHWRESVLFNDQERSAFALAEAMSATPAVVPDDVFAEAQRHFTVPQLVELAATVAMENYRARFNCSFVMESQGFYRPQHPSPTSAGKG